jgi:effector-binding domain-containing protein
MTEFTLIDVPAETVATMRRVLPVGELPKFFQQAFGEVAEEVGPAGGHISGPPFGWYHRMPKDTVDVTAGFPVAGDVHTPDGGVHVEERPGGLAVVGVHVGPYDTISQTWDQMQGWIVDRSLLPLGDMWEEYLSPPEGDPATWQTRLVVTIA